MWREAGNLGTDEETHRLDIVHGSGLDPQKSGPSDSISNSDHRDAMGQYFGYSRTWCGTGYVGVGLRQRRSISTSCAGFVGRRSGNATCEQSRELSNNPLSDQASTP